MNFFVGVLFVVVGGLIIYYARNLERWFGRVDWAEQYIGGTAQMYVLIGILIFILGWLAIFGVVNLAR